jgi:predicted amidohydrolase
MKIGFVQFAPAFGDVPANLNAIREAAARSSDADLLVFPELAVCGYEFRDHAEALEHGESAQTGPTPELARTIAAAHDMTIVIGYAERDGDRVYNACVLAMPDGQSITYRKLHLFDRERERFDIGHTPPPVIETPAGRVGLMICFDWYFPEVARVLALNGAQIIAHPSNLVLDKCQRAMYARSVENRVFTVTANRYGTEDRAGRSVTFTGASQILSPNGDMLAQAPVEGDCVGTATINPAEADDKHATPLSDLFTDRRPEFYGRIGE